MHNILEKYDEKRNIMPKIQSISCKYNSIPMQIKASFWFLVCTILQRSITIITTPIYTRMLSTYEYGQYSIFISWRALLSCFVTLNICSGVYMQTIIKHENERDNYTSAIEGLILVMTLIWLVFYLFARNVWNDKIGLNTSQMIAMFIAMWENEVFGFWSIEQRVEYKYGKLLIITLVISIVQPLLCVVFIKNFVNKITGLVWGISMSTLMICFFIFLKHIHKCNVLFSKKIWKYTIGFAIPLIPHYISSMILNSSDRIMIQQLVGESEAGIYSIAHMISICGTLINQAVLQTLSPWIYQKIKKSRFHEIPKVIYSLLFFISVINLAIVILSPEIIKIFAPKEYYDAIWVMPPITLSVLFMFMYNLFACFEFFYEKKSYISTATMICAGLNITLNYIFIPKFGYIAAGYTTLICYVLFAFMHYFFMKKICKEYINGITIYNSKFLFIISSVYLILGTLAILTFKNTYLRYIIIMNNILVVFLFRKKIITSIVKFLKK